MKNPISRRRFLRFGASAIGTGVALAACGPAAAPPAPTSKPAAPGATDVPKPAVPAIVTGDTFWWHSLNETESRRTTVEAWFKKNYPKTQLKIDITPTDFFPKVMAQIGAGDSPDMIYMHESQVTNFARLGALTSIEPFLKSSPLPGDVSKYPIDLFRRDSAWKGELFALPVGFAVLMLRYNKTMFEKEGIKLPTDQWTWDNLREAAVALTKDTTKSGQPDQWGWNGWQTDFMPSSWPLLRSFGAQHFDETRSKSVINNAAGVTAIDFMMSTWCGKTRCAPAPAARKQLQSGAVQLFEGGKAALDFILSQNVTGSLKAIDNKFETGLELYPAGPNGRFVRTGGTSYAIPSRSKNPQIAWELLRYLVGDEDANREAAAYQNGNPLIQLDYVTKYNAPPGPLADKWRSIVTDGFRKYGTVVQYSATGEYPAVFAAALDKAAECGTTAQKVADEIAANADKLLKDLK